MLHLWWQTEAKLAIVFTNIFFFPTSGMLPKLKFCFPSYFGITGQNIKKSYFVGPGGLRGPPMVADKAKLAIVFTYFFLLSTSSAFHPLLGYS